MPKHRKKTRKNLGKGQVQTRLRSSSSRSARVFRSLNPISQRETIFTFSTPRKTFSRSPSKSMRKTRKQVVINTPENRIIEFILESPEFEMGNSNSIKRLSTCKNPTKETDFPCKIKKTIFRNKDEYDEYLKLKRERNSVTSYKSRRRHYSDIESILRNEGINLIRR